MRNRRVTGIGDREGRRFSFPCFGTFQAENRTFPACFGTKSVNFVLKFHENAQNVLEAGYNTNRRGGIMLIYPQDVPFLNYRRFCYEKSIQVQKSEAGEA